MVLVLIKRCSTGALVPKERQWKLTTCITTSSSPSRRPLPLPPRLRPCSSPFLRNRLSDARISREHVRVEVSTGTGRAAPGVRLSVLGANPVMLVRQKVSAFAIYWYGRR